MNKKFIKLTFLIVIFLLITSEPNKAIASDISLEVKKEWLCRLKVKGLYDAKNIILLIDNSIKNTNVTRDMYISRDKIEELLIESITKNIIPCLSADKSNDKLIKILYYNLNAEHLNSDNLIILAKYDLIGSSYDLWEGKNLPLTLPSISETMTLNFKLSIYRSGLTKDALAQLLTNSIFDFTIKYNNLGKVNKLPAELEGEIKQKFENSFALFRAPLPDRQNLSHPY